MQRKIASIYLCLDRQITRVKPQLALIKGFPTSRFKKPQRSTSTPAPGIKFLASWTSVMMMSHQHNSAGIWSPMHKLLPCRAVVSPPTSTTQEPAQGEKADRFQQAAPHRKKHNVLPCWIPAPGCCQAVTSNTQLQDLQGRAMASFKGSS